MLQEREWRCNERVGLLSVSLYSGQFYGLHNVFILLLGCLRRFSTLYLLLFFWFLFVFLCLRAGMSVPTILTTMMTRISLKATSHHVFPLLSRNVWSNCWPYLANPFPFFFFIFINIFPPFILPFLIFGQGNLGFPTPAPLCFYRWVTWKPCFPSIKKRVLKENGDDNESYSKNIVSYFGFTSFSFDDERARHFASPFFPRWGLFFTLRAHFSSILLSIFIPCISLNV